MKKNPSLMGRWAARVTWRTFAVGGGVTVLVVVVAAELALRWAGYGDPPLFTPDPDVEYVATPGHYERFGNRIVVNRLGMRGSELGAAGSEKRLLLLGDSLVFGTYRVDQDELISTFLKQRLENSRPASIEVLNVACSSWGPVNQYQYLRTRGSLGAAVVVWVLSSHDLFDVPAAGYVDVLPIERPVLALQEAVQLVRQRQFEGPGPSESAAVRSLEAIEATVELLRAQRIRLLVVFHWSTQELQMGMAAGGRRLIEHLQSLGVLVLSLEPALRQSLRRGEQPYQDALHFSPAGARMAAEVIAENLRPAW